MNTILEPKTPIDPISYITAIKMHVDELYEKQEIFGLSLETLELTRRFYNLYTPLEQVDNLTPFAINQLLSISQHLERNLVKES
ncbi:hypothetical protein BC962_1422 [Gillisia mitskevichiae]|uniref:Uncharacterized protein n=1 Tax=Gillisia mitskevichiae TaxID=270921 RepID=A0A495PRA5_9FLAO|nr:hypothetical protein [Gillisia mitskevichiae]RKS53174.1 hypothetical protein BC962_1422 [Gillisia mitskevichiae]